MSGIKASFLVGAVLLLLVGYKYAVELVPIQGQVAIIIPLGLAYYSLRVIHYILEAYKGSLPRHSLVDYLQYQFFLPTLVIGPIHRFNDFLISSKKNHWKMEYLTSGAERILYGYVKITFLGNYLISGVFQNYIDSLGSADEPGIIYLNMVRNGLNLYMQFSGFSDIAIGFAKMLGFKVMENFNWPYFQKNISDFWRCWHISLTSWCREYVFNTVMSSSRSPALGAIATMLIIGVWHELSFKYVVWGAYHGLGIVVWQLFQKFKPQLPALPTIISPITYVLSVLLTLNFVWFGFNIVSYPTIFEGFAAMGKVLVFWM
ncbi:MBOAT family O-acyltransferase [uncultured Paraglaciecola sp.]|uniref:MBOAT family O-acyltransferase n=1 Tax=uncultured Paraglaciecola sp. TaxID=1765024 RepID=UPI002636B5CD|nr:MBOAT family O-acyltransferase [uncultured Paraglaciecola sp.]